MTDNKSFGKSITPRQREVLQLMSYGHTINSAAHALNVAPDTIRHTAANIRERLGADNTTHAVAIGLREGMIE